MRKSALAGIALALAAGVWGASSSGVAATDQQLVMIGTGGITGVYYPAGGAICRLLNKNREKTGIRCGVEPTSGSIYNIDEIRSGDLEFGIAQSDWQYNAYKGISEFQDKGPFEKLRSVFSLHAEPFTVLARDDSGIKTFDDLKGKRVNVGNPGSGQRATMEVVLEAEGWTLDDFSEVSELKPAEQSEALCDGKVDAIIYTVGHPNGSVQEATNDCDTHLAGVGGPAIQKLVEDNPYYRWVTIPGGLYRGSPDDVTTFGVGATLVTSADVPDEVVYQLVKAVFDNLDDFRSQHPAFATLKPEQMIKDSLSAPLHPGAIRYYKERGWM
ncbi:hypothetical protein SAMN06265365_101238 [Tistlia consotensis]|uniref:TRAP transporter solute receptor, TAXI family n=1 Tax=Tistlia consotensis USBA 355 TaxID=560819 RepID=A0A1Y6B7S7_9PROT|nr:TAXI family TRAP transporter solute-binding subunit [Tistlia consotensis]SME89656.1 hypothetical protein SAMN05428998_101236 [Tistlia consotensis USBA 355]SNR26166.1 hypothetical protein SAMN06265365_101238 [Tistlia consotensis]